MEIKQEMAIPKLKRLCAGAVAAGAAILLVLTGAQPAAAADKVKVTLPQYPVVINGITVDNAHSPYPMIHYQGITYVPMTWDFSRAIGVESVWNPSTGLSVRQMGYTSGALAPLIGDEPVVNNMAQGYNARVVDYPVVVHGQAVSASAQYPLLEFREITYFPLTWHYAVEEFNWELSWGDSTGLAVATVQRLLFERIVHDDEDYLYVDSYMGNRYYRAPKALDAVPELLSEADSAAIADLLGGKPQADGDHGLSFEAYQGERTVREGTDVRFQGITLMSLAKAVEDNDKSYEGQTKYTNEGVSVRDVIVQLHESRYLVGLTVYTQNHIPAPYTPRTFHLFIVDTAAGTATQVPGFDQGLSGIVSTQQNIYWAWVNAPHDGKEAMRSHINHGQLLRIGAEGQVELYNETFNVLDVEVIAQDGEGNLFVKVVSDKLTQAPAGEQDGIYRLGPDGQSEKITGPAAGETYLGTDGHLYQVNEGKMNWISDLTAEKAAFWWDYELKWE
ncbi:MAG: hypothetical protein K0R57_4373 [Paenibacillaceae bacterium]|jgi:hypothetical protein|nr:hypothetical protein [Paenibacillaceae bacterium]